MADTQQITALVLPLIAQNLLLPQKVMAEIIPSESVQAYPNAPDWLRGFFIWRGVNVPVVSFESLCNREGDTRSSIVQKFAVLHSVEQQQSVPFYALEIRGIPHPGQYASENLVKGGVKDKDCDVVAMNVIANGQQAIIADLGVLESNISRALKNAI